jgi:hypothetical protein
MNRTVLPLLAMAAAAGVAHADAIDQSFTYEWTSNDPDLPAFSFEAFDDMGGTRKLTGVHLGFEGTIVMELTAQTYDPVPLSAGEWFAEASHTVVAYFNGGDDGVELLQGLGGQWLAGVTGDLGAGTGGFPFGEPGTPYIVTDTLLLSNVVEVDNSLFADFSGDGPLEGFMAGFFDAVVTPPDSGQMIEVFPSFLSQSGSVTLTYEFVNVPTPGALALLGAFGVAARRRRR